MAQRQRRGRKDYFDEKLVDLIDGLFISATLLLVEGTRPFKSEGNGKPQPNKVRELFDLDKQDMSHWRFADWDKHAIDWPIKFADQLLAVFSDRYLETVRQEEDYARAAQVYRYWSNNCKEHLYLARESLKRHRDKVCKDVAQKPMIPGASGQPAVRLPQDRIADLRSETGQGPDLSPPPLLHYVNRTNELAQLSELSENNFCIVISGPPNSDQNDLVHQFSASSEQGGGRRVLWKELSPDSQFLDLLAALGRVDQPLNCPVDSVLSELPRWLEVTNSLLVISGLEAENQETFAPFLRRVSRMPGPCRIVVSASIIVDGAVTHNIAPLTGPEAIAILKGIGAKFDPTEVTSIASEVNLTSHLLRQTAASLREVSKETLQASLSNQSSMLLNEQPQVLKEVYDVLQIINVDFDYELVTEILAALGSLKTAGSVIDELNRLVLIRQISARKWRVGADEGATIGRFLTIEQIRSVLISLAAHFRKKCRGRKMKRSELSGEDCANLLAACRLLQLADHDERQRYWLMNQFTSKMERGGAHKQLEPIYEYEVLASKDSSGAFGRPWDALKFARLLFVIGKNDQALRVVSDLFYQINRPPDVRSDELFLSLMRLLAEILTELGHARVAIKIIDAALEGVDMAQISSTASTAAVSVLSWAMAQDGKTSGCIELNQVILGRNFSGLQSAFSANISSIRVGVAHCLSGRLSEGIKCLERASSFFAKNDVRAYVWSTANLARFQLLARRIDAAGESLEKAVNAASLHGLANRELLSIYREFKAHVGLEHLEPFMIAEIRRLESYEREWDKVGRVILNSRLVEHVLLELQIDLEEEFEFQIEKYELLSFASPHAIRSRFNQTLVNRLKEADLESTLDGLMSTKGPNAVFRNHLYNRVIVEACRETAILAKKYVLPNKKVIGSQTDGIILLYARLLERLGAPLDTKDLLDAVRSKSSFSYYNIAANCEAHDNPDLALELNDMALKAARSSQQRAQILNNKASIVYDHEFRHLYHQATEWCEGAISASRKPAFVWPRNLLLQLKLCQSPLSLIDEVIVAHRERFRVPLHILLGVVEELRCDRPRKRAVDAVQRLIDADSETS